MYLVDTNVISAGAPRKVAAGDLLAWMGTNSAALYVSVVTIAEIEDGIAKTKREGAGRKASELQSWFEILLHLYASRILAFDIAIAHETGRLSDLARGKGLAPGFAGLVIAATAKFHRLTILTANTRHFAPLGLASINPFERLPG